MLCKLYRENCYNTLWLDLDVIANNMLLIAFALVFKLAQMPEIFQNAKNTRLPKMPNPQIYIVGICNLGQQ